MSNEPELIQSPLSQTITRDGHTLQVDIYRLEEEVDWLLEVVNEEGTSYVWETTASLPTRLLWMRYKKQSTRKVSRPSWTDAGTRSKRATVFGVGHELP